MTKAKKSYTEMLKDELLEVARRLGLTNLSKLRKDEIVDLLEKAQRAKSERASPAKRPEPVKPAAAKIKSPPATSNKKPVEQVAAKPVERPVATKPVAKPVERPVATKPVERPIATKPVERPVATKPVERPIATKPVERPVATKPVERPVATRAAQPATAKPNAAKAQVASGLAPQKSASPTPSLGPVSAQAGAQASKYAHYRPEELQGIDESLPDLPETYGDNRIVLLPRDLAWLFAYWDLATEYKDAARSAGGNVLALRLYDVTGIDFDGTNARAMVEHECAEWARSWYIPTPAPDRDYVVEIGYRGADQWFPLARSNKVSVPSDQPSTWIKDDFITIRFDEDLRQPEVRERLQPQGSPGPAASGVGAVGPHTLFDDGELRVVVGGTFLPPSGAPTWPPFSGSAELIGAGLPSSQSLVAGSLLGIPTSGAWSGGWSGVAVPGSGQAFVPGSGQAFIPGSLFSLPSSGALSGPGFFQLPTSGGFQRPGLGAALPGGIPLREGEAAELPADGNRADGSSATASPPPPPPPLLVANVEMVISGRSLPGTEIRVAGRAVPLGPDGAFSLRVTVPEGLRELPIEARAAGSPAPRRITLKLGRETDG